MTPDAGNILNEYDYNKNAIIEPWLVEKKVPGFPEIAVTTFSKTIIDAFACMDGVSKMSEFGFAGGRIPVYKMVYNGVPVAFYLSIVGAPACVMLFEEIVAKGAKTFVAFGSCGVLDKGIAEGHFIIPTAAVRDEGTSYHYASASDEIEMDMTGVEAAAGALSKMGYPWIKGKTWTTDAPYRETVKKTSARRERGCVCVEMECAALIAAARFRGIKFAQFVCAADNLDAADWEPRSLLTGNFGLSQKENYMFAALETAVRLHGYA